MAYAWCHYERPMAHSPFAPHRCSDGSCIFHLWLSVNSQAISEAGSGDIRITSRCLRAVNRDF